MKALIQDIWNNLIAIPKNKNGSFQLSPAELTRIVEKHLGKTLKEIRYRPFQVGKIYQTKYQTGEKFGFFKWLESLSVAPYSAVSMDTPDIVRHSYIQKWLRDKHNIHISFKPVFGKKNYKKYKYNIYINEKIMQVMKYEFPDNAYKDGKALDYGEVRKLYDEWLKSREKQ